MRRRRKLGGTVALLAAAAAVAVAAAGGGWWCRHEFRRLDAYVVPAREDPYDLKRGSNAREAAVTLTAGEFPPWLVRRWLARHPELHAVQSGRYRVDGRLTLPELLAAMVAGRVARVETRLVPVVPGATLLQVWAKLPGTATETAVPAAPDLIRQAVAGDEGLLAALGGVHDSLEGLLLPSSYPWQGPDPERDLLCRAVREMAVFMQDQWPRRDLKIPLADPYEALILASLVEKETGLEGEQAQVAGVFCNRLRRGMRLQTDPAVMYGVSPAFRGPLTRAQLQRDTPYNTYTRAGLPPTPVAMPGKAALTAVLHPATTAALYFVARGPDPQAGHVFSEKLADHRRAVAQYRRLRAERRQADAAAAPAAGGIAP